MATPCLGGAFQATPKRYLELRGGLRATQRLSWVALDLPWGGLETSRGGSLATPSPQGWLPNR